MKIIIPYRVNDWFNLEQQSLLQSLGLSDAGVIDEALTHWTTYVFGDATDKYELTVDHAYEYVQEHFGDSDQGIKAQQILASNADQLTELIGETAQRLNQLIQNLPDEMSRENVDDDEYAFLKVESINTPGQFAVLSTEIAGPLAFQGKSHA